MGDLIDRKEALKTIYNRYVQAYKWYLERGISQKELDFALTSYAECHVAIRNLPSAESTEPQWIPVTERLPEKEMLCLVSRNCTRQKLEQVEIDFWYIPKGQSLGYWLKSSSWNVTAWMPLMEPYKEADK